MLKKLFKFWPLICWALISLILLINTPFSYSGLWIIIGIFGFSALMVTVLEHSESIKRFLAKNLYKIKGFESKSSSQPVLVEGPARKIFYKVMFLIPLSIGSILTMSGDGEWDTLFAIWLVTILLTYVCFKYGWWTEEQRQESRKNVRKYKDEQAALPRNERSGYVLDFVLINLMKICLVLFLLWLIVVFAIKMIR